jgi:hypothetical protein
MGHPLLQPSEDGGAVPRVPAGRLTRRRWQVGLRTLILFMAAIAVWMTYLLNLQHNRALNARIKTMIPLAHELVVDDPNKVAVVKLEEYWFDENRWDIYLPEGQYRICLATRGVEDNGVAVAQSSERIVAGRHAISLEQRRDQGKWLITARWDATNQIAVTEPNDWSPETGSTSRSDFSMSTQLPPESPIVLIRKQFMRTKDGQYTKTTKGILLWIERAAGPAAER